MREYRFDKDHNSYFRAGRQLRDQALAKNVKKIAGPAAYPADVVQAIAKDAELRTTAETRHQVGADGRLSLKVTLSANGADYLVVEPVREHGQQ